MASSVCALASVSTSRSAVKGRGRLGTCSATIGLFGPPATGGKASPPRRRPPIGAGGPRFAPREGREHRRITRVMAFPHMTRFGAAVNGFRGVVGGFLRGSGRGAGSGPPGRARTLGPPPGAAAATERGTLSRCFSSVSEPLTQQQGQFPAERATRLATTKALRYPLQRWTDWAAIATAQRLVASTQGFSAGFVCFQRDTTLLNRTEVRKRFRFHYARVFLDVL